MSNTPRPSTAASMVAKSSSVNTMSVASFMTRCHCAHRDANVGLTQGRGVADAVAGHRDDVPLACNAHQPRLRSRPGKHAIIHGLVLVQALSAASFGTRQDRACRRFSWSAKPHLVAVAVPRVVTNHFYPMPLVAGRHRRCRGRSW